MLSSMSTASPTCTERNSLNLNYINTNMCIHTRYFYNIFNNLLTKISRHKCKIPFFLALIKLSADGNNVQQARHSSIPLSSIHSIVVSNHVVKAHNRFSCFRMSLLRLIKLLYFYAGPTFFKEQNSCLANLKRKGKNLIMCSLKCLVFQMTTITKNIILFNLYLSINSEQVMGS